MPTKKYEKPARPFELWNIGNGETVYRQEREDEYIPFMFKLYQSQPLTHIRFGTLSSPTLYMPGTMYEENYQ